MKTLEVNVHCCALHYDCYAYHLQYLLSSFLKYPSEKYHTMVSVCFTEEDRLVCKVLDFFLPLFKITFPHEPRLLLVPMEPQLLFRRAIGRNRICNHTNSDVIWFTDADYLVSKNAIDNLMDAFLALPDDVQLAFPRQIMIHKDHATGDALMERTEIPAITQVDYADFVPKRIRQAIGGLQIIPNWVAKKFGYCRDSKRYQKPQPSFSRCKCDRAFRKTLDGPILKMDVAGLFRIRHTSVGRDWKPDGQ